jgi:4-amino-4-deoxy-L-arabinose transferase-like glycosyltransferase
MKNKKILFWGILLLGVVLRCIMLDSRTIQYDDAFSILLAEQSFSAIIPGTAADTMPPLYYFTLHLWMQVSKDLWWLRTLGVLLSLAILILLYYWIKLIAGEKAALWAMFFAAIVPKQIYHAQDLRMYTFLVLGQLGYFYFLTRIHKNHGKHSTGWENWMGLVVFGVMAMYSHNLAIFVIITANIWLVATRQWQLHRKLLAAQTVMAVLSLPWLLMIPGQIAKIQTAFWTPRPGLVEIFQAVVLLFGYIPIPQKFLYITTLIGFEIISLVLFEVIRRKEQRGEFSILLFAVFIPPLLMFIVSYFMRPIFVVRGFLFSAIAFYGLLGCIVSRIDLKLVKGILIGSVLVCSVISLPFLYRFAEFPRSPFKQAAGYLAQNMDESSIALHDNKLSHFPMHYFNRALNQVFLPDEPGSFNDTLAFASQAAMKLYPVESIGEAVNGFDRIYFVVFEQAIQEYQDAGMPDHPVLEILEEGYDLVQREEFNDLFIYHFQKDWKPVK